MNIIFLIGQLRFSGAENVLRCIAPEIARKGHNVEILVRAEGYEHETLPDVKIKYCGAEGNAFQRRIGRNKKIRKRKLRIIKRLIKIYLMSKITHVTSIIFG